MSFLYLFTVAVVFSGVTTASVRPIPNAGRSAVVARNGMVAASRSPPKQDCGSSSKAETPWTHRWPRRPCWSWSPR